MGKNFTLKLKKKSKLFPPVLGGIKRNIYPCEVKYSSNRLVWQHWQAGYPKSKTMWIFQNSPSYVLAYGRRLKYQRIDQKHALWGLNNSASSLRCWPKVKVIQLSLFALNMWIIRFINQKYIQFPLSSCVSYCQSEENHVCIIWKKIVTLLRHILQMQDPAFGHWSFHGNW